MSEYTFKRVSGGDIPVEELSWYGRNYSGIWEELYWYERNYRGMRGTIVVWEDL